MSTTTTRRTVLKSAPALAIAAATPVAADESEIMRLFARWREVKRQIGTAGLSDEAAYALLDERDALEAAMIALRPTTVRELAAIVIAVTEYGDIDYAFLNTPQGTAFLPILAEIAGVDRKTLSDMTGSSEPD